MRDMNKVLRICDEDMTVTVQCGMYGLALETALEKHALTLRRT
jgi:FAD/FMN-containing dehydrogenase